MAFVKANGQSANPTLSTEKFRAMAAEILAKGQ
jgi:hypothetical protein